MASRKKASMKNASTAIISQMIKLLGQFIVQTIFIRTLGAQYLGANGLFTNLITFLSFAELGIGAAFSFAFYQPLVNHNRAEISAIINLYRRVYNVIGYSILAVGLLVSYFVPDLVKNTGHIQNLRYYFILYLLSSVISYFFTYNRSLIIANQEGYIDSLNQLLFSILKYGIQIIALVFFHSYAGFLVAMIVSNFLSNISITRLAHKKYPYLLENKKSMPDKTVIDKIKKNVIGTISSKVGSVIVNGTDNILISKFIGLSVVGIYSNYAMVIAGINTILSQFLNAFIASFGNLGASEKNDIDKQVRLFDQFVFLNGIVVLFIGIVACILFQPFVTLWLGTQYQLSNTTVILIIINFVLAQFRPALLLISVYGLFWGYRYKSVIEAAVNFGLSFYLVKYTGMGINGVLLGTILGNILINSWWDPLILFSGAFHRGMFKFYVKYWTYLLIFGVLLVLSNLFGQKISVPVHNFVDLMIYAVITSIVVGCVLLLLLGPTPGGRATIKMILKKSKK